MIVEYLAVLVAAFLVILLGYLIDLGAKNRKKYQFFEQNAPGLKVLENPSWFGGHLSQLVHVKHNWAMVESMLKKFGPTVGFYYDTQPAVLTKDLDFIKTFIVDEPTHINRIKPKIPIKEVEEDSILFAEDEQWVRLRKVIASAFSARKIKLPSVQSEIEAVIDKLVEFIERKLDDAESKRRNNFTDENADDICHRFSMAVVFATFYKQYNVINFHSHKDKWVEMIHNSLYNMISIFLKAYGAFPALKPLINWLVLNFDVQGVMTTTIMNYIKQQTRLNFEASRQANEMGSECVGQSGFDGDHFILKDGSKFRRNMIDYITDQYREGKLTKSEYFNSVFILFHAATKTTSDTIARCLYNLAYHPDIQEKLRESIMSSGTESDYLAWVIHESLRLCPPAPIGCSRIIKRDIQTEHCLVPAGTFVVTPAYTIGRMKEYWGEDADEFKPERWVHASTFHPVQYLAFGAGRRVCPGKELALMEIKMLLNVLVRRYKFEKSTIHTVDNSQLFDSPLFFFLVFNTPSHVKISRLAC